MKNGQTEPVGVCPEAVHRYSEWFGLFVVKNIKIKELAVGEFLLLFKTK